MTSGRKAAGRRSLAAFWTALETLMVLLFLAMLAAMFLQVVARYAIGVGVPWTDETSRFLFVGQIFLGAAIAQRQGAQIRITVLLDLLPDTLRRALEIVSDLLLVAIALGLIFGAWGMAIRTADVAASTIDVSVSWLYTVQMVGVGIIALLAARDVWLTLTGSSRARDGGGGGA